MVERDGRQASPGGTRLGTLDTVRGMAERRRPVGQDEFQRIEAGRLQTRRLAIQLLYRCIEQQLKEL